MNDIHNASKNVELQDLIGVTVFANARVILADHVLESGRVIVTNGVITDIEDGDAVPSMPGAQVIDCAGDYLMPGMIELHTDNIEKHILPRPGAMWPSLAASIAHDTQIISAGITTVYDSVSVGAFEEGDLRLKALQEICDALETGEQDGLFKAHHLVHLRCEICFPNLEKLLAPLIIRPLTGLVSIMDHTPGQRQFVDESKYVQYYKHKKGFNDEQMKTYMDARRVEQGLYGEKNRRYAVDLAHQHGHALASHDDATIAHVEEAISDRMTIAEFPTTIAAAEASHNAGLAVLMGAPNLVRGGSHSGNVAAIELARLGFLDIVSSDYVPASLIHSAFILADQIDSMDLPTAIATVTRNPARAANLTDRGEIAVGLKGDLVRVHDHRHHPILRGVWRDGVRVS
ncbi:MAG: alpha-D-ribose 1-methylphosphonate 5-triphosphate diphosphatase [Alphaproteobacteria bacterium]|nr:alpha-D-ribose 1-methylphosphonate 5-triphosphate diphosphatase [Alphaproteobacteria bacterium]